MYTISKKLKRLQKLQVTFVTFTSAFIKPPEA